MVYTPIIFIHPDTGNLLCRFALFQVVSFIFSLSRCWYAGDLVIDLAINLSYKFEEHALFEILSLFKA